jgi:uncharacterized LabA/DUF88 family protein
MSVKEKVAVFFDGSNFYHKMRDKEVDLVNTSKFDYKGLSKWLARDRNIIYLGYYVGVVRAKPEDRKAQGLRRKQQKLFSHLESQGFIVKRGYLMKSAGSFHEKGVDVHLATDLLVGAYENQYDTAIIISSDTDLIPAIQKAKDLKKNIEYIGFSHKPSLALQRHATLSRLMIKDELIPFESKENK